MTLRYLVSLFSFLSYSTSHLRDSFFVKYSCLYGNYLLNQVIDKSFGFDTAVEEAERAINAAHVESESVENGIGLVKLMGRYSG